MKTEEIQSKQEIILEMAKSRKQRPNTFSMDTYLRAVRNFDSDLVRQVCVKLCVNQKKGMPKPHEIKEQLRRYIWAMQIRPEDIHLGPPTNYKINAGFIAMAVRLGLEYGTTRWKKARHKWDHATDFERDLWKEKARAK